MRGNTEYEIEKVKLDKSKRSSYSLVFKHGCSLKTHLEFWRKKAIEVVSIDT